MNKKIFWGCLFCLVILSCLFIVGFTDVAYAQPHGNQFRNGANNNQITGSSYGELGKPTGWGAVVMMFCAIFPCIIRRLVSTKFIDNENGSRSSFWNFLKRNHYMAGTLALLLAIVHGTIMLNSRHGGFVLWIGITAGILLLITVFWGFSLIKHQNNNSIIMRQGHVFFSIFAILLAIIHLL